MSAVFLVRHDTFPLPTGGWECWACGKRETHPAMLEWRWAHEEAYEGHEVEMPFEDQRVQDYVNWMFEIEDSEIEAYEEMHRED